MRDLLLLLTLVVMFSAVLTILSVLASPARKQVTETRELVSGDVVTFILGNLSASYTVLSAGPQGLVIQSPAGNRSTVTHAVLASRRADGLTIWKESPDVRLP